MEASLTLGLTLRGIQIFQVLARVPELLLAASLFSTRRFCLSLFLSYNSKRQNTFPMCTDSF